MVSVYNQLRKTALNRKTDTCETTSEVHSTERRTVLLLKLECLLSDEEKHCHDSNGVEPVLLQVVLSWNVKEGTGMRRRRGSAPSETHGWKQAVFLGEER